MRIALHQFPQREYRYPPQVSLYEGRPWGGLKGAGALILLTGRSEALGGGKLTLSTFINPTGMEFRLMERILGR